MAKLANSAADGRDVGMSLDEKSLRSVMVHLTKKSNPKTIIPPIIKISTMQKRLMVVSVSPLSTILLSNEKKVGRSSWALVGEDIFSGCPGLGCADVSSKTLFRASMALPLESALEIEEDWPLA